MFLVFVLCYVVLCCNVLRWGEVSCPCSCVCVCVYCSNMSQIVSKLCSNMFKLREMTFHIVVTSSLSISLSFSLSLSQVICFILIEKERERIQDVVEVVCSNTFASIDEVSQDNHLELLVSILDLCLSCSNNTKISFR
jgi:hypothetical protein